MLTPVLSRRSKTPSAATPAAASESEAEHHVVSIILPCILLPFATFVAQYLQAMFGNTDYKPKQKKVRRRWCYDAIMIYYSWMNEWFYLSYSLLVVFPPSSLLIYLLSYLLTCLLTNLLTSYDLFLLCLKHKRQHNHKLKCKYKRNC